MKQAPFILAVICAAPAFAEETRQLDAHVHGVGSLNIAASGSQLAMEFEAPGADIVGFEHPAESAEDRAAIDDAVAILARPLDLFGLPDAAECSVVEASASLEAEDHDDHAHEEHAEHKDEHAHGDHAHEEHAEHKDEHGHDDHAHEEHAEHKDEHGHDDHAHEEHAEHKDEHGHDDHAHEEHAEEESHTEFHAEYALTCAHPEKITAIEFGYFAQFENALELEVQIVTEAGAQAFEVERAAPRLDLKGMF